MIGRAVADVDWLKGTMEEILASQKRAEMGSFKYTENRIAGFNSAK